MVPQGNMNLLIYALWIQCSGTLQIELGFLFFIHLEDRGTHIIFTHLTKDHEEHQYSGDGD